MEPEEPGYPVVGIDDPYSLATPVPISVHITMSHMNTFIIFLSIC